MRPDFLAMDSASEASITNLGRSISREAMFGSTRIVLDLDSFGIRERIREMRRKTEGGNGS